MGSEEQQQAEETEAQQVTWESEAEAVKRVLAVGDYPFRYEGYILVSGGDGTTADCAHLTITSGAEFVRFWPEFRDDPLVKCTPLSIKTSQLMLSKGDGNNPPSDGVLWKFILAASESVRGVLRTGATTKVRLLTRKESSFFDVGSSAVINWGIQNT